MASPGIRSEALAKQLIELAPAWFVMLLLPIAARLEGHLFPWKLLLLLLALPPAAALASVAVRTVTTAASGPRAQLAERGEPRVDMLARRHGTGTAGRLWLTPRELVFTTPRTQELALPLTEIVSVEARDVGSLASLVWFRTEAFNVCVEDAAGKTYRFDVAAPVAFVALVREARERLALEEEG